MRPLAEFPPEERSRIKFVLSDIDDTMTEEGRMPSGTLAAMERLAEAGLKIIPVTGRPAGWCDYFARMWPVDAIVGENGAFWFSYDRKARKMRSEFSRSRLQRNEDRKRLDALREHILAEVPGTGIASDQFCRIADLAIDFCEDVEPLPDEDVGRIVSLFEAEGAVAKVSSIHVNGWFGDYDKLTMVKRCLGVLFDADIERDNASCVFAGDSPNDQPMFAHFTHGVGVANVRRFALKHEPAWVTPSPAARGFAELADALLEMQRP